MINFIYNFLFDTFDQLNNHENRVQQGQFQSDRLNGDGRIIFPEHRIEEGQFEYGRLNGIGQRIIENENRLNDLLLLRMRTLNVRTIRTDRTRCHLVKFKSFCQH